ncbi:MAG: hypothetical protein ACR2LN_07420 [Candidatus Levyibacteriota bacterium]
MKNLQKHFGHYLIYLFIFGGGLLLVFLNKQTTSIAMSYLFVTVILYFTWSMVHHYVNHQLHPRVVFEYILVIMLGVVLSFFLFQV